MLTLDSAYKIVKTFNIFLFNKGMFYNYCKHRCSKYIFQL